MNKIATKSQICCNIGRLRAANGERRLTGLCSAVTMKKTPSDRRTYDKTGVPLAAEKYPMNLIRIMPAEGVKQRTRSVRK